MSIEKDTHAVYFDDADFSELKRYLHGQKFHSYVFLCDENTLRHCLPAVVSKVPALKEAEIIEIESGEESKAIEIAMHIWRTLAEMNADRSTLFINLGGGVITDLGGFCASLFKRGIPFIHLPTTLLAMADASIGGKTAIDFDYLKNLIGTFSPAKAIFIAPQFLSTLPMKHIDSGMAEVYKMALIRDAGLWKKVDRLNSDELIKKAVKHKTSIVKKDPNDLGLRKILNFGHTIGHAIEGLLLEKGTPVLHGEAIVAGMIVEAFISYKKRLLKKTDYEEIKKKLKERFALIPIETLNYSEVRKAMSNDKKNTGGKMRMSLLKGVGDCVWDQPVTWAECEKALDEYKRVRNA